MKRALPHHDKIALGFLGLCFMATSLTACEEIELLSSAASNATSTSGSSSASAGSGAGAGAGNIDAIDRARPAEIDQTKYTMIVPVKGDDFKFDLFKSPVHAQEAGYCVTFGFGPVTKVIQTSDPRSRNSYFFIECEKDDPAFVGLQDRIDALAAQQADFDNRTAQDRVAAQAAAADASGYPDPYADCPIGEGGYPIVTDDCAPDQ